MAAERAVIPNCCSSNSSISLYSPTTNAVTHTFELNTYVLNSAISREGTEDYLVVSDSPASLPKGLARFNLKGRAPLADYGSSAPPTYSAARQPLPPVRRLRCFIFFTTIRQ